MRKSKEGEAERLIFLLEVVELSRNLWIFWIVCVNEPDQLLWFALYRLACQELGERVLEGGKFAAFFLSGLWRGSEKLQSTVQKIIVEWIREEVSPACVELVAESAAILSYHEGFNCREWLMPSQTFSKENVKVRSMRVDGMLIDITVSSISYTKKTMCVVLDVVRYALLQTTRELLTWK